MTMRTQRSFRRSMVLPMGCLGLILLAPSGAAAQSTAPPATPPPCQSPEHRQFDFWIGEWDVIGRNGQVVGRNSITSTMNGCVLHESFNSGPAYHGQSFNIYDARRRVWHQSWVDNGGVLLTIEGGIEEGRMVLRGETAGPGGATRTNRITWTPNQDGTVRQHWEVSADGGTSWTTSFDGLYRRR